MAVVAAVEVAVVVAVVVALVVAVVVTAMDVCAVAARAVAVCTMSVGFEAAMIAVSMRQTDRRHRQRVPHRVVTVVSGRQRHRPGQFSLKTVCKESIGGKPTEPVSAARTTTATSAHPAAPVVPAAAPTSSNVIRVPLQGRADRLLQFPNTQPLPRQLLLNALKRRLDHRELSVDQVRQFRLEELGHTAPATTASAPPPSPSGLAPPAAPSPHPATDDAPAPVTTSRVLRAATAATAVPRVLPLAAAR